MTTITTNSKDKNNTNNTHDNQKNPTEITITKNQNKQQGKGIDDHIGGFALSTFT